MGHKAHWDSVQSFYKKNEKWYNSLREAKEALEEDCEILLRNMSYEDLGIYLSQYARDNFENNEPYAEWYLRYHRDGTCGHKELDKKMKEVFGL